MPRLFPAFVACALAIPVVQVAATAPAEAVRAPVSFSATALPTWQTDGIAWSVASANGLVFVGGTFGALRPPGAAPGTGGVTRRNFAVFDAATGAPTSCAPAFEGTGATVRSLAVSPDGSTVYVGGSFSQAAGFSRQNLAALDIASCTVVGSFRPLPNATVRAISATSTQVYFGGSVANVGGVARHYAAAVGAVDTAAPGSLLDWSPRFDGEVRAIAVSPHGDAVVVGGSFDTANWQASHALVVTDPDDGDNLRAYGSTFIAPGSSVKGLAVDTTGFYTANEGFGAYVFDGRIALDWETYDQRWRDTCLGATQAVLVHDGVLYAGSHAHDCSSMGAFPEGPRQYFTAQRVTQPSLLPWFPNSNGGLGESLGPRSLAVASKGGTNYLWAVGEFTSVNGTPQAGLTRFGPTPDTPPTTPVVSVTSPRTGEARVAWRQSNDRDDAALTYRVYRDGTSAPIRTVNGQSWFWSRPQLTVLDPRPAGSTQRYRVSVSDGTTTRTSPWKSVTVATRTSPYAARVLADDPTAYWRFDEASDVFLSDTTPHGNNLTLRAAATYRVTPAALTGDASRALTLTGTEPTSYTERRLEDPDIYSLETWLRTTTTSGGKILGFGSRQTITSSVADRHLYMSNNGRLLFGAQGVARFTIQSAPGYNDGKWHHVVATQGPGGMALYVDGARVATAPWSDNGDSSGFWRVGGDQLAGWPQAPSSAHFRGTIDETAVYGHVLSAAAISKHHTIGVTGTDSSSPAGSAASTTTSLTLTKARSAYGTSVHAKVRVSGGSAPTGRAVVWRGTTIVGSAALRGGTASIALSRTIPVGSGSLTASYSGDSRHVASRSPLVGLVVTRATPSVSGSLPRDSVGAGTRARIVVRVRATGFVPTGTVRVVDGEKRIAEKRLDSGTATIRLPVLKPGRHRLRVQYLGSSHTLPANSTRVALRVRR